MKKALIPLFISFQAVADCQVPHENKFVTFKDGATVSLTEPGRSLSSHRIQDQDGMGSCYANAASVVLKSVLPGNPDISFIDGGLNYATRKRENWAKGGQYVKNADAFERTGFIDSGEVCGTIESINKAGGACKAEQSILENQSLKNSFVQQKLLINVGKYFDKINEFKGDPKKLNDVQKDISLALQQIQLEQENLVERCERNKSDLQFEVPLNILAEIELLSSNDNEYCGKIRRSKIQNVVQLTSIIKRDETRLQLKPGIIRDIYKAIYSDPFLKSKLVRETGSDPAIESQKAVFGDIRDFKKESDEVAKKVGEKIQAVLKKNFLPSDNECPLSKNKGFKTAAEKMGRAFMTELGHQRRLPCDTLVKKWQLADEVKKKKVQACMPGTFNDLLDALGPLLEVGIQTEKKLAQLLLNPKSSYADQIRSVLAPGCMDKKNLIPINQLKCEQVNSCWGNPVSCANEKLYTDRFRSSVMNSIKNDGAVGFLACTGYFNDGEARTGFCQKKANGIDGHQNHVMAISGYRCNGGKFEYEVINSWGKSCPAKEVNGYKNGALSCELDKNGRPTGKLWVKEDAIVSNMYSYQVVTQDKSK